MGRMFWRGRYIKTCVMDRKQQTPRVLFEIDYLTGVNDKTRQGAIRIWDETGQSLAPKKKEFRVR